MLVVVSLELEAFHEISWIYQNSQDCLKNYLNPKSIPKFPRSWENSQAGAALIKTGSRIGGWVFSSLDHLIRGGPKYTISSPTGRGMYVDYKSVFRLAISRTFWRNGQKSKKNHEISANFPPLHFFWGSPKILKPVLAGVQVGMSPLPGGR